MYMVKKAFGKGVLNMAEIGRHDKVRTAKKHKGNVFLVILVAFLVLVAAV